MGRKVRVGIVHSVREYLYIEYICFFIYKHTRHTNRRTYSQFESNAEGQSVHSENIWLISPESMCRTVWQEQREKAGGEPRTYWATLLRKERIYSDTLLLPMGHWETTSRDKSVFYLSLREKGLPVFFRRFIVSFKAIVWYPIYFSLIMLKLVKKKKKNCNELKSKRTKTIGLH